MSRYKTQEPQPDEGSVIIKKKKKKKKHRIGDLVESYTPDLETVPRFKQRELSPLVSPLLERMIGARKVFFFGKPK